MLSVSPITKISRFVHGLSYISKDMAIASHHILAQRSKMREQVMKRLNLTANNKELTRKVFELCINLKSRKEL